MAIFSLSNFESNVPSSHQAANRHTVLLVDDEESNLNVMKRLLEKSCNVLVAQSGESALHILEQHSDEFFSMIISDQRMPNMTGVELFKQTIVSHPNILRLIVSGYADLNAVINAINSAHIYQFISKPFEPADFLVTVKQALKTYEKQQESNAIIEKLKEELTIYKDGHKLKLMELERAHSKLISLGVDISNL